MAATEQIQEEMTSRNQKRQEAKTELSSIQAGLTDCKQRYAEVQNMFGQNSGAYLKKYFQEISSQMAGALKNINEAGILTEEANNLLPSENDQFERGDPLQALDILQHARNLQTDATNSIQNAHDKIRLQQISMEKAEPSVIASKEQLRKTCAYLKETVQKTKLSPKKSMETAFSKQEQAKSLLAEAERELSAKTEEEKSDVVAAYEKAQKVSTLCEEIVQETDKQVRISQNAQDGIIRLNVDLQTVCVKITDTNKYLTIFKDYHAPSTWRDVGGSTEKAWAMTGLIKNLIDLPHINQKTASF